MNHIKTFLNRWAAWVGFVAGLVVLMLVDPASASYDALVGIGLVVFLTNGFVLLRRLKMGAPKRW